jgi:phospholipid-translocating ATPase
MSLIERQVNIYMIVIFLVELLLMSIEAVLRYFNVLEWPPVKPYTYTYSKAAEVEAGTAFAGYFILLNTMIPISLIVSIEVIKSIQGYFIDHDELMSGRRGGQQEEGGGRRRWCMRRLLGARSMRS